MQTEKHTIDCTGDVVIGDHISFERATFNGSYRKPKFAGMEHITGLVIRDSYAALKQQHTFTIRLDSGEIIKIKGRNVYRNGTYRMPWVNEAGREIILNEKHQRGDRARMERHERLFGI